MGLKESTPYKIAGYWESVSVPHNSRYIEDGVQQVARFNKFAKGFDHANTSLANGLRWIFPYLREFTFSRKSLKIHDGPQRDEQTTLGNALGKLADEFSTQAGYKVRNNEL